MYDRAISTAAVTGETYDLVVVGAGFAGLTAAYCFLKDAGSRRSCLVLDNHALLGGEAKRNEFVVGGQRLIGPQGSNTTHAPSLSEGWVGELWRDLGLPTEFEYGELPAHRQTLAVSPDNYLYQLWADDFESHGYFFDGPSPHWVRNPWGHGLEGTPWPSEIRRDLWRWRHEAAAPFHGDTKALRCWLDSMTYEDYITRVRGLHPAVARFVDPVVAASIGLGSDAISAYAAYFDEFPGFEGIGRSGFTGVRSERLADLPRNHVCFPGGNDAILRCFIKALAPDAIEGGSAFPAVHNGRFRFEAFDRPHTSCRLRVGATVVRIDSPPDGSGARGAAIVTYARGGSLHSVQARAVVVASASWVAKHFIRALPDEYRAAMEQFPRSPMLVVNVALTNWRFLDRLGFTACSWRGGFGYSANIRSNMYIGDYRPPLDPDRPNILTFYVPFYHVGLPVVAQGHAGRAELLSTSYREYERIVRRQMVTLFESGGFDPARDVAGVVLNRWGHAYVNPAPGFYCGRDGQPAPSDVLRQPLGRIVFAHSELTGNQNWFSAAAEGRRAAEQVRGLA